MSIQRTSTWLTHELDQFLQANKKTPFAWGSWDCCLFAANGIQSMTGVDIANDFRRRYTDQASAMAAIATVTGGTTVLDAIVYCANKHGLKEWTDAAGKPLPLMAKRGDLVAVTNGNGDLIAGIVDLSGRYVACMGDGILHIPITSVVRAWHVS